MYQWLHRILMRQSGTFCNSYAITKHAITKLMRTRISALGHFLWSPLIYCRRERVARARPLKVLTNCQIVAQEWGSWV